MRRDLFRIQNGSRMQGDTMVLEDIDIELQKGEIQGVYFKNQNEEESLMQVLCGMAELTVGIVYYNEQQISTKDAKELLHEKVFLPVLQSNWSAELTVTDFFCLHEQRICKQRKMVERKIKTLAEVFEVAIQPELRMQQLLDVQKVELELIRAYDRGYSVVVLRGMTTILGETAYQQVMKLVDQLRRRDMTFLLLDHAEVLADFCTAQIYAISQGCTIFRYQKEELKEHLSNNSGNKNMITKDTNWNGEILQIRRLELDNKIKVDLSLYNGEITTVLDTKGDYGNQLAAIMRGERNYQKGNIWFMGTPFAPANIREVVHVGIGIIEEREGRYGQELFYNLTALENLELLLAEKEPEWLMKNKRRASSVKESEAFFSVTELNTTVAKLHPWQRQRLAYYRWYLYYPRLVIIIRPLTSLDLQMRKEAEHMIRKFQERDIAVLVITSNGVVAEVLGGKCIVL